MPAEVQLLSKGVAIPSVAARDLYLTHRMHSLLVSLLALAVLLTCWTQRIASSIYAYFCARKGKRTGINAIASAAPRRWPVQVILCVIWGLQAFPSAALAQLTVPLVLIHGIQMGSSSDSNGYQTWDDFRDRLVKHEGLLHGGVWTANSTGGTGSPGATCKRSCENSNVGKGDFFIVQFTNGWGLKFAQQGGELKQILDAIKANRIATGGQTIQKFDLVGHSMGGIAARHYLQNLHTSGSNYPASGGDVRSLVTIGTPHDGTPLARVCPFTDDARRRSELLAASMCLAGTGVGSCAAFAVREVCAYLGFAVEQLRDDSGAIKIMKACMNGSNPTLCSPPITGPGVHTLPLEIAYYSIVAIDAPFAPYIQTDDVVPAYSQNLNPPVGYNHPAPSPIKITVSSGIVHTQETASPTVQNRVLDYLKIGCQTIYCSISSALASVTGLSAGGALPQQYIGANPTLTAGSASARISGFVSGPPGTTGTVSVRVTLGSTVTYSSGPPVLLTGADTEVSVLVDKLQTETLYSFELCLTQNAKMVCAPPVSAKTLLSGTGPTGYLAAPVVPAPPSGGSASFGGLLLQWSGVTNASSYRVVIATSQAALPTLPESADCAGCVLNFTTDKAQLNVPPDVLVSGRTYYWRSKARNSMQYGDWSNIWSFTVSPAPLLPQPTALTPANFSVAANSQPTLGWGSVPNATSYRVLISPTSSALQLAPEDSECAGCLINTTTTDTSLVPLAGVLSPGETYYWRVKARSPTQYGALSDIYRFTVSQSQCNFGFAQTSFAPSASGGTYPLTLMTQPGCSAPATTNQAYCTVSPSPVMADSSGQAGLNLTISENGVTTRACTVTVGNATLSVSQPANAPAQSWTFTLNQAAAGGTAYVSPNQTTFWDGETVTLIAVANFGYAFVGWQDSGTLISSAARFSFSIRSSRTMTPVFSSTAVNVTGLASPSVSPDQKWRIFGNGLNTNSWQSSGEVVGLNSGTSYRVDCADTPYYLPVVNTFNFTPGSSFSCKLFGKSTGSDFAEPNIPSAAPLGEWGMEQLGSP